MRILAVVGDSSSVPVLIDALANDDISIKTEVVKVLCHLKAKEAVPSLVSELVKSQARNLSEIIAKALLELGSLDDRLLISFHKPKINITTRPFDAAIVNGGEKAIPGLTKLLQDPSPDTQRGAAEMIAMIKRGEKYSGYSGFSDSI